MKNIRPIFRIRKNPFPGFVWIDVWGCFHSNRSDSGWRPTVIQTCFLNRWLDIGFEVYCKEEDMFYKEEGTQ